MSKPITRDTTIKLVSYKGPHKASPQGTNADRFEWSNLAANLDIVVPTAHPPVHTMGANYSLHYGSPLVLSAAALGMQVAAGAAPGVAAASLASGGADRKEISSLFDKWNDALQSKDVKKVVDLYATDAILLPTVSNKVRRSHEAIGHYFEHFMAKGPRGTINESDIRIHGDVAINSGVYTFDFASGDQVQARFSFVYRKIEGEWKIIDHHSSAMPEKATPHR